MDINKSEALHILVDSLPEASSSWVDILSALLTPAIALVAVYIAYQQHKINEQRLRHETYERRLSIYKIVQIHLSKILRDGKTTFKDCGMFFSEASEAAFLFDDSVMEKIKDIYTKSLDLVVTHEKMYPSDDSEGLPVGPERNKVAEENAELLRWITNQLEETKILFRQKLGLEVR